MPTIVPDLPSDAPSSRPVPLYQVLAYGVLTWVVPFFASAMLIRPGTPASPSPAVKSLLLVGGALLGATLLVRVLRRTPPTTHSGLRVGVLWLAINVSLDIMVLLPVSGMKLDTYAADIGARYLLIPIMALAMDAMRRSPR